MPNSDKSFMGGRVFIALRPDLFHKPNEHITVEFLGSLPNWTTLIMKMNKWKEVFDGMPIQVHANGYANWYAGGQFFNVALIDFPDKPELNNKQNWHVTLEKSNSPLKPLQMTAEEYDELYTVCDQLWVGYQTKEGEKKWISSEGITKLLHPASVPLPF